MNLFIISQYLLPKRLITQLAGQLASAQAGKLTSWVIRWFIKRYGVNMGEAANPDSASYKSFNDFFTRALQIGARPLSRVDWVCPVDGAISQFGAIEQDHIFQAKGHYYSSTALLGGDALLAKEFDDGFFACLYLSPKDYHRIHMPCSGKLRSMAYVPGALFSVNPTTAAHVPGLFARNERVVCLFDTEHGALAMVLVGATIVGSMATVWHGVVNPPRTAEVRRWDYQNENIVLEQGAEMGRFLLGSTVVLLWPKSSMEFNPTWQAAGAVRMGQAMADRGIS